MQAVAKKRVVGQAGATHAEASAAVLNARDDTCSRFVERRVRLRENLR